MWKSPDNLWSIYCPVDAECNCPALQQSGPSYRSFSSDLLKLQQNVEPASLKLMQYFLSHLSSSYEFVFWGSRNKSKWCTITVTATLHGLLEIVTTVTSFHRNNGMVEISSRWWVMIRVILMTSWQWSGWHWLVSFVSFMTSSSDDEWNIEMCDMWYDTIRSSQSQY